MGRNLVANALGNDRVPGERCLCPIVASVFSMGRAGGAERNEVEAVESRRSSSGNGIKAQALRAFPWPQGR
jgi:hypothetical protein